MHKFFKFFVNKIIIILLQLFSLSCYVNSLNWGACIMNGLNSYHSPQHLVGFQIIFIKFILLGGGCF